MLVFPSAKQSSGNVHHCINVRMQVNYLYLIVRHLTSILVQRSKGLFASLTLSPVLVASSDSTSFWTSTVFRSKLTSSVPCEYSQGEYIYIDNWVASLNDRDTESKGCLSLTADFHIRLSTQDQGDRILRLKQVKAVHLRERFNVITSEYNFM